MTFNSGESLASVRAKINDALVVVSNLLGFSRVVVVGQSDVIATNSQSTLTLEAGANVAITTNGSTNTVTISSTGGGGGSATWGTITGTLSTQTDLQAALDAKDITVGAGLAKVGNEIRMAIGVLPIAE